MKRISAAEFVKIWQSSDSRAAVAKRCGSTEQSVGHRASRLRSRGVPLKKLKTGAATLDYESLKRIAEEG